MATTEFGTTLRRMRNARDLTQEEVALAAEVDASYISKLETGAATHTPSLATLQRLSRALDADPIELAQAANKLAGPFGITNDADAMRFFRFTTERATTSEDWRRLTELVDRSFAPAAATSSGQRSRGRG